MIGRLEGKLAEKTPEAVLVELVLGQAKGFERLA